MQRKVRSPREILSSLQNIDNYNDSAGLLSSNIEIQLLIGLQTIVSSACLPSSYKFIVFTKPKQGVLLDFQKESGFQASHWKRNCYEIQDAIP